MGTVRAQEPLALGRRKRLCRWVPEHYAVGVHVRNQPLTLDGLRKSAFGEVMPSAGYSFGPIQSVVLCNVRGVGITETGPVLHLSYQF